MITLSLLKYLENNNFGTVAITGDETGANLFWEKLALDREGLYIADLGTENERGGRKSQLYQLYYRGASDADGYEKLQAIADFLTESYGVCELPAVPPVTSSGYSRVAIMPVSSLASVGEDPNGRIIWTATGRIYY